MVMYAFIVQQEVSDQSDMLLCGQFGHFLARLMKNYLLIYIVPNHNGCLKVLYTVERENPNNQTTPL